MAKLIKRPEEALKEHFGFDGFLDGQDAVVEEILTGRDGLVVMPTGGGKSLCYQLPALCLDGVTLVISPLIALMKDQVDALQAKGVAATLINSTLSQSEQMDRLDGMRRGDYKLVYVAPERFRAGSFCRALESVTIAMVAVDEAHCLSQWGHDFRPDYMRLGQAFKAIGQPQCVALTATATPVVRADILKVLDLRDPFEQVSGFARPNLSLTIRPTEKASQKFARVREIVEKHKTGIVYCATRKKVDEVADMLKDWGVRCIAYHGGLSPQERERTQNIFIERQADVAVATNAFGMGIDRSDVRFVVHFEIPGSVEAYYQEAGRAGRDGEASVCELLFNYADTRTQEFFIEGANPSPEVIRQVYQHLLNHSDGDYEMRQTLQDMAEAVGLKNSMALGSCLIILARNRYIERFDIPGSRTRGTRLLRPQVMTSQLEIDWAALEAKEERDRDKLKAMIDLCYGEECRQQAIMAYFGEENSEPCGTCDQCKGGDHGKRRAGTDEEELILRKALSGVARMSRSEAGTWVGVFGKGKIVQMLLGSRSEAVLSAKLDRLSTYGLLKECGSAYVNQLFRAMSKAGLIKTERRDQYPLLTLTERGAKVMLGKASVELDWPSRRESGLKEDDDGSGPELTELGFEVELFNRLKALRSEISEKQGVPAYVIFNNQVLENLTRLRPRTRAAGMRIKGIGEAKADQFLDVFLAEIRRYQG